MYTLALKTKWRVFKAIVDTLVYGEKGCVPMHMEHDCNLKLCAHQCCFNEPLAMYI